MKLKLVFVPTWLERALQASSESLTAALEPEKLARILSTADLNLYRRVNDELGVILPQPVVDTFETGFPADENCPRLSVANIEPEILRSMKREYLYGNLPDTEDLSLAPRFKVTRSGYDTLILSVDQEASAEDVGNNVMETLLQQMVGSLALEEVAGLPIFRSWLEGRTRFNP